MGKTISQALANGKDVFVTVIGSHETFKATGLSGKNVVVSLPNGRKTGYRLGIILAVQVY
jgi:hypothetical protein